MSDDIKNPTLNKVLVHFRELKMMLSRKVDGNGAINVLLRNLVLEMFSCKLGTVVEIEEVDLSTLVFSDDQKTKLKKILTAHCSRLRRGPGKLTEALLAMITSSDDLLKDSGGGVTYVIQQRQPQEQPHNNDNNNKTTKRPKNNKTTKFILQP